MKNIAAMKSGNPISKPSLTCAGFSALDVIHSNDNVVALCGNDVSFFADGTITTGFTTRYSDGEDMTPRCFFLRDSCTKMLCLTEEQDNVVAQFDLATGKNISETVGSGDVNTLTFNSRK
jgi:hypothetical protein